MNGMKDKKHFLLFTFLFLMPFANFWAEPSPMTGEMHSETHSEMPSTPESAPQNGMQGGVQGVPQNIPGPDSDNIIHYRGNRTYTENLPLKINQIICVRVDGDLVSIEVIFNQSINPRTVRPDSFFINNIPLPPGTRFTFNRRGTTIKILFPISGTSFKFKLRNICSFDGSSIEPVELLVEIKRPL